MPGQPPTLSPTAIALNRFGLGARPDESAPANPQRWLVDQFDRFDVRPAGFASLDDAGATVKKYREAQQANRQMAQQDGAAVVKADLTAGRQDFREDVQALYRAGVQARAESALATEAPFVERMVHFWSNHFCVSVDNPRVTAFAGAFERDSIRPHVLGSFGDLTLAVEQHPAMLTYLNQFQSIGPDSPAAARNPDRKRGLNENLAREIMELHTLGVRSGYTQADVTEFARALTGWTVDGLGGGRAAEGNPDRFTFRPGQHEPGTRIILGKRYAQDGEGQARAALIDFAHAPATATHVATKLARHFAGDDPPPAMIARLADRFTRSKGDLPTIYRTLIASPEAWVSTPTKFKTPWEWTISSMRGVGHAMSARCRSPGCRRSSASECGSRAHRGLGRRRGKLVRLRCANAPHRNCEAARRASGRAHRCPGHCAQNHARFAQRRDRRPDRPFREPRWCDRTDAGLARFLEEMIR